MSTYKNYVLTNTQRAELTNKIVQGEVQRNYGDAYSYLKSTVPSDISSALFNITSRMIQ